MNHEVKNIVNCLPGERDHFPNFFPRRETLNDLALECYANSKAKGFWDNEDPHDVKIGAMKIALMHSELSEALEGLRKNAMDDHLPLRTMLECEMADTIIRIMDYCGARGIDIEGAVREKMAYNSNRPHMHGGKKF